MNSETIIENGIAFDFSQAQTFRKLDARDTNRFWASVDFEIENVDGTWIWLEAKNWEPSSLPPRQRGGQRRSFLCKLNSKAFFREMREKFLGTSCFLSLAQRHPETSILYVIILESPRLSSDLLGHAGNRMRSLMSTRGSDTVMWKVRIRVAVMSVAEWNRRFPEYPAQLL